MYFATITQTEGGLDRQNLTKAQLSEAIGVYYNKYTLPEVLNAAKIRILGQLLDAKVGQELEFEEWTYIFVLEGEIPKEFEIGYDYNR